ncbi:MAG: hypothetical protein A3H91_00740 [Gammaproteobacteria bacterium RIFCSPLOWO2_02_FULL_61_13]|nr:MAG: hypothetical protein A3H91_00740 [Gammaproteobacteria bacterium RIFCSPLOWO2_02_FULL_61_13]
MSRYDWQRVQKTYRWHTLQKEGESVQLPRHSGRDAIEGGYNVTSKDKAAEMKFLTEVVIKNCM